MQSAPYSWYVSEDVVKLDHNQGLLLGGVVYIHIYNPVRVNGDIYMDFREATGELCAKMGHDGIAAALGISVQTVQQSRMARGAAAHREPPSQWEHAVIRLAEKQVWHYRKLIERLCDKNGRGA
jgi:hypothetical protein